MKNKVNQLFTEAGRPEQGDNRSHIVKTLNKVLEDGIIKVEICEKGNVWTNKNYVDANGNKKKFNVELKAYGWVKRAYIQPYITADDVLKQVGKFLQEPSVAEEHIATMKVSGLEICECERCHGKGIIPAFHYYCQGICFECYGSKYVVRKYTLSV